MKTMKKIVIATVMFSLCAVNAFGADSETQRRGGRRQGPPPEAYTACEDKSEGDTAEFVSPHGDTVTGVCEQEGDRLVLRPNNPPPRNRESDRD